MRFYGLSLRMWGGQGQHTTIFLLREKFFTVMFLWRPVFLLKENNKRVKRMNSVLATAIGVGIMGGLATFMFLSIETLLLWAAFVAWACYFALGGDRPAITLNLTSNAFGVAVAWIVALLALAKPFPTLPAPVWVGLLVALSVFLYIMASRIYIFSSVPAATLGYATTFAYISQTPGAFAYPALLSAGFQNVLIVVIVSMSIGTGFAVASAKLSAALTAKA